MNRYELINKLARKAGIPDYDSLLFFEIFILKLFNKISSGQFVSFDGIGYFLARKGIYKKSAELSDKNEDFDQDEIDIIIFSPGKDGIDNVEENNIFLIPHAVKTANDELTSHFNFSIGKPIINIDNPMLDDKILNVSGQEQYKFHNHKADEIISSMKIVDRDKVDEPIVVQDIPKIAEDESVPALKDNDVANEMIENDKKDKSILNINHDREFDERRIRERKEEDRYQTLPWNFGTRFPLKKVEYKVEDSTKEPGEEGKKDKTVEEDSVSSEKSVETNTETELESEISEIVGNYQRVKPFSLEAKEKIESKPITEIKAKIPLKVKKTIPPVTLKDPSGYLEVKSKSESYHLRDSVPAKRQWKKQSTREKNYTKRSGYNESIYKRKSKVVPFFIILLALIIVVGVGYLYLEKEEILGTKSYNESFVTITRPPSVNVIERDFTIPVSYPNSDNESGISGIDPSILNETDNNTNPIEPESENKIVEEEKIKETIKPVVIPKTNNEIKETATTKNEVKDPNIIQSGDYFIVQLSTYSNYESAEAEAEKYNNMGYNAFVEITEVPGSGTRYRVRVGDFTSTEHAARFKKMHAK